MKCTIRDGQPVGIGVACGPKPRTYHDELPHTAMAVRRMRVKYAIRHFG